MIRIDPLTVEGRFDTDFYGSEEYKSVRDKVLWYLKEEGFAERPDTYFMQLFDHYWQIEVSKKNL